MAHYFRALAVVQPFLIARENLLLLFEQNRIRCARSCTYTNLGACDWTWLAAPRHQFVLWLTGQHLDSCAQRQRC